MLASSLGMVQVSGLHKTNYYYTIVRTSIETESADIVGALQQDLQRAMAMAADGTLFSTHSNDWQENVWTSGLETDRIDVARAVNTSIYAILSSVRTDRPFSLSPGGLTPGYNGHTFWDCETWMYPPVLFLYPELANSLLMYRFNRLEGAKKKALSYSPPVSTLYLETSLYISLSIYIHTSNNLKHTVRIISLHRAHLPTSLPTSLPTYLPIYLPTYLPTSPHLTKSIPAPCFPGSPRSSGARRVPKRRRQACARFTSVATSPSPCGSTGG